MIIVLEGKKFLNAEGEVRTGTSNTRLYPNTLSERIYAATVQRDKLNAAIADMTGAAFDVLFREVL
jgi:hypothetical protein